MDRNKDEIVTRGHPENEGRELHHTHGDLRDIENASAYANRTGTDDLTGAGERMRADRLDREGRIDEAPRREMRDDRDGQVHRGEDIGSGMHAKPADGLEGADGRIHRGEDIGSGIRAKPAGEQDPGDPLV